MLAISRTYSQFTVGNTGSAPFEDVMLQGATTLSMAPMLCVLFLGARMRALQMDPISGNPQRWAQNCFYTCTYALMAQTMLAALVPLLLNKPVKDARAQGEVEFDVGEGFAA